tara:strand:- start:2087 stop:2773 length:687 start_codon:yes stop_codon:yes gene_type:complete
MKNHFKSLKLEEGASQDAIQAAYERLSKELDPAKNDNQDFFVEEYAKVQEAYKALSQSSILKNNDSSKRSVISNRDEFSSSSNSSDSFTVTISKEKIEQLKNRKLDTDQIVSVPEGLKILSILSMIGSGFFALIFLGFILFAGFGVASILFLVFAGPFVLKVIGALKMYQGKKSGYNIYMIPSIILNIFFGLSIVTGNQADQLISSILFVFLMITFSILFHNYKDQLK